MTGTQPQHASVDSGAFDPMPGPACGFRAIEPRGPAPQAMAGRIEASQSVSNQQF
ncbi:protein of unknown function [Burkholderia multivorans]